MEYKFTGRDKVAKGYTYPIKRADLDAALEAAGVTELESIGYGCMPWIREKKDDQKGLFLSVSFIGESFMPGCTVEKRPKIL